jgi:hypothetical protein
VIAGKSHRLLCSCPAGFSGPLLNLALLAFLSFGDNDLRLISKPYGDLPMGR